MVPRVGQRTRAAVAEIQLRQYIVVAVRAGDGVDAVALARPAADLGGGRGNNHYRLVEVAPPHSRAQVTGLNLNPAVEHIQQSIGAGL